MWRRKFDASGLDQMALSQSNLLHSGISEIKLREDGFSNIHIFHSKCVERKKDMIKCKS